MFGKAAALHPLSLQNAPICHRSSCDALPEQNSINNKDGYIKDGCKVSN